MSCWGPKMVFKNSWFCTKCRNFALLKALFLLWKYCNIFQENSNQKSPKGPKKSQHWPKFCLCSDILRPVPNPKSCIGAPAFSVKWGAYFSSLFEDFSESTEYQTFPPEKATSATLFTPAISSTKYPGQGLPIQIVLAIPCQTNYKGQFRFGSRFICHSSDSDKYR